MTVSRPHAFIGFDNGKYWIEDPKSTRGTKVDDREIKGCGRVPLTEKSCILIGQTRLFIETPLPAANETISPVMQAKEPSALLTGNLAIGLISDAPELDVTKSGRLVPPGMVESSSAARHEHLLHELLIQVGADTSLENLFQFAVQRLVAAIAPAEGACFCSRIPPLAIGC